VIRVPVYIRWKRWARSFPTRLPRSSSTRRRWQSSMGKFGYGQTVAPQCRQDRHRKMQGIGPCRGWRCAIAGHIGRVGDWAEMAAAEGLVSIHFVNAAGSVLVAPYGGVERRLSTAPYCVGIPRQGLGPVVLDFATSIVAEGKVLVASRGGKKLPKGALIDLGGNLSEDPAVLYGPHTADGPRDHKPGQGAIRAFR